MPRYRFGNMDEVEEDDYEMGDVDDDMYEFQGRGIGDSDSEDEEYGPLLKRVKDVALGLHLAQELQRPLKAALCAMGLDQSIVDFPRKLLLLAFSTQSSIFYAPSAL
ncbi:hypothetical protein Cni_G00703 [Canna indica]|uniref:Uncharacterized protein n=1 Tax=Canna indica TaxID=4628 RepID=A0AAQ3JN49_9LILI|nr:hypothetical protein Cni_G00703 [Canna indica]